MTTALLAGGGTAGHVNPLLALADHWRAVDPAIEVIVLGTAEGLEARLVPDRGYELATIPRVPFPRRPNRAALRFPSRFRDAVGRSREIIRDRGVDVVVGFGGYASAPAYVAARREGIPFIAHEANARPGIANRLAVLLGGRAAITFAGTPLRGARLTGMPLRPEITTLDRPARRDDAVSELGLEPGKPVLLVTGGSTGAQRLNTTMTASAARVLGTGWQVLHITGTGRGGDNPGLPGYHTMTYCDAMHVAFAAADLVLCRAGSATVSELAALGLPSVLVPYAAGNGEQRLNARELVAAGGAVIVPDAEFTPEWVARSLVPLLGRRAEIARMAAAAQTVGRRDGASALLALVLEAMAASTGSRPRA
ncbi:MAG: UDP-N-acetylglucosamine--N-acetylmuramyl-(pentapeptide) pyrophosphoryl-undecaprenol N-acetylglucosamine transferase [Microbacterium sp.]|nr:UDP-N-acetylglucosamine--N-acetylmuramyl-(pentapeptide) pyrophosphoryl-undecaprenol N-acetylglucosamine transferase [Microbacterium sp.]MBA4346998.1 UDP-N-acetylglucosamine--N-acetylmuramyl-(pentapeptide) pyrophosphoryl-undecaprenol N-acetylglucosamine transferase [Microbacterium sp.]